MDHVSDSVAVLYEAIATGVAGTAPPGRRGPGPVARLRGEAARLLGACAAAGPAERRIAIWDRQLSASAVALMGSIEISVHGWDISVACGARRPGLFAAPVRLPAPACPGDQLVAFLGRRPHGLGDRQGLVGAAVDRLDGHEHQLAVADVFQIVHLELARPIAFVPRLAGRVSVFHRRPVHEVLPAAPAAHRRPEIIEHVAVEEDYLLSQIAAATRYPAPMDHKERESKILERGIDRTRKIPSPDVARPIGRFHTLSEAVEYFLVSRQRTIDFVENCSEDLRALLTDHPVIGKVNVYEMLLMMSVHPHRHAKQIDEVRSTLGS